MLGICKAYTTRVGEGPFPTEQGQRRSGSTLGERGREFGTVTGRPRRCGWFDAVLVRQTVRTSGINGLALTKLDILDGFDEIKVCVGYRLDGREIDYLPAGEQAQARVEPIYETIEGWKEPTARARSWAELPAQAIKYVRRIRGIGRLSGRFAVDQPGARGHNPDAESVRGMIAEKRHEPGPSRAPGVEAGFQTGACKHPFENRPHPRSLLGPGSCLFSAIIAQTDSS